MDSPLRITQRSAAAGVTVLDVSGHLVFSGGEPLMRTDIWKLADVAKEAGITTALATNATSLGLLGDSMDATAERLRSGVVEDSLADVRAIILLMLLVLTAWTIVPAIGALAFGLWLRRELEPTGSSPEVAP